MHSANRKTPRAAIAAMVTLLGSGLSGCAATGVGLDSQRVAPGEVPIAIGAPVRDNRSPMEGALACFGDQLTATTSQPVVVAVGEVRDYTGKYSINEGNAITQGGSLMVYSALGKIGGPLRIAERFDPVIAERELAYADRRQLGDGKVHDLAAATLEAIEPATGTALELRRISGKDRPCRTAKTSRG